LKYSDLLSFWNDGVEYVIGDVVSVGLSEPQLVRIESLTYEKVDVKNKHEGKFTEVLTNGERRPDLYLRGQCFERVAVVPLTDAQRRCVSMLSSSQPRPRLQVRLTSKTVHVPVCMVVKKVDVRSFYQAKSNDDYFLCKYTVDQNGTESHYVPLKTRLTYEEVEDKGFLIWLDL
jgi:hypothetical protein